MDYDEPPIYIGIDEEPGSYAEPEEELNVYELLEAMIEMQRTTNRRLVALTRELASLAGRQVA